MSVSVFLTRFDHDDDADEGKRERWFMFNKMKGFPSPELLAHLPVSSGRSPGGKTGESSFITPRGTTCWRRLFIAMFPNKFCCALLSLCLSAQWAH